jgi:DNA-binding PadR family transcriptional regulator
MALEHAILVSLSEQSGSGLDLTRRFDRSIGFFWTATHQQIYRVLGRMEGDGWVRSTQVAQQGRPDKKVYDVTAAGRRELERWLAEPLDREQYRSDLAVKLRAASYGDRGPLLDEVAALRAEHSARLTLFQDLEARDYHDPARLDGADLDQYLVLRGGIRMEQFWVDWLGEYLTAHGSDPSTGSGHRTARRAGSTSDEGEPQ